MRAADRRTKKYKVKIDGTISQLRLLRYGKEQKARFKSAVIKQAEIEREVKSLIAGAAPAMFTHYYCNFGKKVVQLMGKHKGANLITELEILDDVWSTRGLDINLLNQIKVYYVPGYPVEVVCVYGTGVYGTCEYS